MLTLIFLAAATAPAAQPQTIEQVQASPHAFYGKRLRLCGDVSVDGKIIYSDADYRYHGRVGVKLRGYGGRGRNHCVTGQLLRDDGSVQSPASIVVTDSPVPPDFVLVAEEIS